MVDVEREFFDRRVSWSLMPGWTADILKVACTLRCADGCHLDLRRASSLEMAIRGPRGESLEHWRFQNRINIPTINPRSLELEYRSVTAFGVDEQRAWWIAYESLVRWADAEIRGSQAALSRSGLPGFRAQGVAGAESPTHFSAFLTTSGWKPLDVTVRVSDVASVVERFGGKALYGVNPLASLRELVANAADAVRARRSLPSAGYGDSDGCVTVRIGSDEGGWWIEVADDGIGMSEEVIRGPLLDFGTSYWGGHLMRREHPGLLASKFRPAGKFGIGFFSVFMLGARVRVVTNRYDAAATSTQVLEVSRDLKHPTLRSARPGAAAGESVPRGGTRVRVWLETDPWASQGVFGRSTLNAAVNSAPRSRTGSYEEERFRHACQCLARLAPCLDVSLRFELVSELTMADTLVAPRDWESMPFDELLSRISGVAATASERRSSHVCDVRRDGDLLGRFRLSGGEDFREPKPRVLVVGGMACDWQCPFVEGVVVAENPRLDRAAANPVISAEELRAAVSAAIEADGSRWMYSHDFGLAEFVLGLGVLPANVRCFQAAGFSLDVERLRDWALGLDDGDEILVVESGKFDYEDEFDATISLDLCDVLDRVTLGENVVVTTARIGYAAQSVLRQFAGSSSVDAQRGSLSELAVDLILEVWQCREIDAVQAREPCAVAHYNLRNGKRIEIELEAVRLRRPVSWDD